MKQKSFFKALSRMRNIIVVNWILKPGFMIEFKVKKVV